ncbi:MAG TPA: ABC transporter substrate-binding protein [Firmicutes bacterium]|jgi:raffinose/stachyose/melibiose transport system substrate-binding protein|nr:ABC transporter substrate-binding protein [Bacillota bacterium]
MKLSRNRIIFLGFALVMVLSLCTIGIGAQTKTLKVLTVSNWWFKGHDAFADALYKKLGIKLEVEKLPDEQGVQVIRTRLAVNEVPDILLYYSGANMRQISPEQFFVDLSKEPWVNNLVPVVKNVVSANGKIYGSPNNSMPLGGVVYNKKIYSKLGLKVPTTWKEFLDNCEKIKAAGVVPVCYSFKENWTAQLLNLIGWYEIEKKHPDAAKLINTNKLKMADIPEYVGDFRKLSELREKGYINKDYLAVTFDNAQKMIANGDAAMYLMGSWIVDTLSANYPDKINDLGGFALPSDDGKYNGVTVWASQAIYIPKESKNVALAKKVLEFWASKEGQAAFFKVQKTNGAPSFKGVNAGDTYGIVKDFKKYLDNGQAAMALEFQIDISLSNDLPRACVDAGIGAKSPKEAAQAVDAALEKNAKDQKLPGW